MSQVTKDRTENNTTRAKHKPPIYRQKWLIALVALVLIIAIFASLDSGPRVSDGIDMERIWLHLEVLTEDIGPRAAGTAEEKEAARYIAGVFENYGYEVLFQEFNLANHVISADVSVIFPEEYKLFPAVMANSGTTDSIGITTRLVDWGSSLIPPEEAEGSIALMNSGLITAPEPDYTEHREAALEAGASAVIMVMQSDEPRMLDGTVSEPASLPMLVISAEQGDVLRSYLERDEVAVQMVMERGKPSTNVVASRKPEGRNGDYVLIVGSHYDTIPGSPGANDNASGVVTMLEIARLIARYPLEIEIRFVAFGGEEWGFTGSRAYVESLSEEEAARVAGMINLESLASAHDPVEYLFVGSASGSESFMTEALLEAGDKVGSTVHWAERIGGSDHVPFNEAGIYEAVLARAYPGNIPWDPEERSGLEPQYHTPQDTMRYMDRGRLQEAAEVLGTALEEIVLEEKPPFWRRLFQ